MASQGVAASTAQLVVASRVKADRHSTNLIALSTASKDVTHATGNVVATVKSCSQLVEESGIHQLFQRLLTFYFVIRLSRLLLQRWPGFFRLIIASSEAIGNGLAGSSPGTGSRLGKRTSEIGCAKTISLSALGRHCTTLNANEHNSYLLDWPIKTQTSKLLSSILGFDFLYFTHYVGTILYLLFSSRYFFMNQNFYKRLSRTMHRSTNFILILMYIMLFASISLML